MPHSKKLLAGKPFPLGATPDALGTNFAVYSSVAHAMELCLYDPKNPEVELACHRLTRVEGSIWCGFVPGVKPGALYGYRVQGVAPCIKPHKLLLDPYAKAISGDDDGRKDMFEATPEDNGATMLKAVVIDDRYNWRDDVRPETPWTETVIYELHVKGFTKTHPLVPESRRGTYAGLCEPAVIEYLKKLGVSAVQLLPVHQHLDDEWLVAKKLTNYWGYNTLGFFAPHAEYARSTDGQDAVDEFKTMVRTLHKAGLEVILDVVFNHTAEGSRGGPVVSLRGFDEGAYYMLDESGHPWDCTGCGNSLAAWKPAALRLVMDSLRYWVSEMHVDGFRFDLATTVGRGPRGFDISGAFFTALAQDPVLAGVKLIAEPWDVGQGDSYQVGFFPKPWRELNGKYRDATRRFWRGDAGSVPEFAKRLCGSEDLYRRAQRGPLASVNFITSHDGFTLADLVSYNHKHNEANGEDNRDGDNDNHSNNQGIEGPTDDLAIEALREQLRRSFMATMFLSAGVPFITMGDERGRSQQGNNNAYCHDSELTWMDWSESEASGRFAAFVAELATLRCTHDELRRIAFFDGVPDVETGVRDVYWITEDGEEMRRQEWHDSHCRAFTAVFAGRLCVLFNNGTSALKMALPEGSWKLCIDTAAKSDPPPQIIESPATESSPQYLVQGRSLVVMSLV